MPRLGEHHSEETKTKLSLANTGQVPWMMGRHHTEKTKAQISKAMIGKPRSEEYRDNIRKSRLGKHHSEEVKLKISLTKTGVSHPSPSKETRAKIRQANLGKYPTEETRARLRIAHLGQPSGMKGKQHTKEAKFKISLVQTGRTHSKETRAKRSKAMSKRWANPEYKDRVVKATILASHIKPNKPEQQLHTLLNELYPVQWKYTGDGKLIIGGKNPDFWNGDHKLIELFGDYWHNLKVFPNKLTEKEIVTHYQQYNYKCLVIWERELEHPRKVVSRIIKYLK